MMMELEHQTSGPRRTYDITNGRQKREICLPASRQMTPTGYATAAGKQFVPLVAGGHGSRETCRRPCDRHALLKEGARVASGNSPASGVSAGERAPIADLGALPRSGRLEPPSRSQIRT